MNIHKILYHRDDVDRLYVSRKEGRRGLFCFEYSLEASLQQLEDYIEKCGGRLITVFRNNTDNPKINRTEKQNKTENKNGKKNNSMDILSDEQVTSLTRKRGRF